MPRIVAQSVLLVCIVAVATLHSAEPKVAGPALRIVRDTDDHRITVEAVGLPKAELLKLSKQEDADERLSQMLGVYVVNDAGGADPPPMAGTWSVVGSSLRFVPRFPLLAGTRYRAVLRPEALVRAGDSPATKGKGRVGDGEVTVDISFPAEEPKEPTEVVQVYPSSNTLPENNLRFYIHFSESMGRGEAYRHVHLLDAKNQPIEEAFLEIGEELWDPRARRMTLLIDPGRIKKGVKPREELGPVLEAGREYTLLVGREWRDAYGRKLKAEFRKKFRAGPPAEEAIDPARWKITPPPAGSSEPVAIRFPAPLDRALVERTISVAGLNGRAVAGRARISEEERLWEFRPLAAWEPGQYQVVIDMALEDLAGNRIGKPFEIDEFNQVDKTTETESARLVFEIRPRS